MTKKRPLEEDSRNSEDSTNKKHKMFDVYAGIDKSKLDPSTAIVLQALSTSHTFLSEQFTALDGTVTKVMEDAVKGSETIKQVQKDTANVVKKLNYTNNRVERMQREQYSNDVIIVNLPVNIVIDQVVLCETFKNLFQLDSSQIQNFWTTGGFLDKEKKKKFVNAIVTLSTNAVKQHILKTIKEKGHFTRHQLFPATQFKSEEGIKYVYINPRLTDESRKVLQMARELQHDGKLAHVWHTSDGKVLYKKINDPKNYKLQSVDEALKLKGSI